jgi:hypothetical protein
MSNVINVTSKGNLDNLMKFLRPNRAARIRSVLERYAHQGLVALQNATPVDTGLTAESWYYEIVQREGYISLRYHNSHVDRGRPIAILLQYGHATRNGGWVEGRDYINPAIQPLFDKMADDLWKEVTR